MQQCDNAVTLLLTNHAALSSVVSLSRGKIIEEVISFKAYSKDCSTVYWRATLAISTQIVA